LSPKIDCSALLGGEATPGYQFGLLKKWSKGRQQMVEWMTEISWQQLLEGVLILLNV